MKWMSGKVVQIIWYDANGTSGWDSREVYAELLPETVMTVGVVIGRDKHQVRVALSQSERSINQAISIPTAWIESERMLARLDNLGRPVVKSATSKTRRRKSGARP